MTRPAHADEHEQLVQLLAKATEHSDKIEHLILITVGPDGRPCVGSTYGNAAQVSAILRYLGMSEGDIENTYKVDIPGSN